VDGRDAQSEVAVEPRHVEGRVVDGLDHPVGLQRGTQPAHLEARQRIDDGDPHAPRVAVGELDQ
jgi:hypothetical protein